MGKASKAMACTGRSVVAAEADGRSVEHHQPQAHALAFEELVAALDRLDRPLARQALAVEQIPAHVGIEAQRMKRSGVVGGAIGLLGSVLALRALNASDLLAHAALGINWRIFLWACLLAGFFGVFSGVWPAWRMSRLNPVDALRGARR